MTEIETMRDYLKAIGVSNIRCETLRAKYFVGDYKGFKNRVFNFYQIEEMMENKSQTASKG